MDVFGPIHSIVKDGKLRTELLSLSLKLSSKETFSGQGFLSWNSKDGIHIEALTGGGNDLTAPRDETQLGSLVSRFATLSASTRRR